jgi:DNA-binding transcriptional regulator of glucitol operon
MWFAIIAAVVAGWMVQLYFSYHQATAFNKAVTALRTKGTVSVGAGGKRYRGGRAFVAIAVGPDDVVIDAITLQGLTTFARARPLQGARGETVRRLGGDREIAALTRQQREAARQAATLFVEGRERSRKRDAEGGVPTSTG